MANQPSSFYRVSTVVTATLGGLALWCVQEFKKVQRGFENVEKRLQAIEEKLAITTSSTSGS